MKANKKYVASDGYQYFMCPFTRFYVTQGENVGTHRGTKAVDFSSGTAGVRDNYYCPADSVCVMTVPSSGQAMWRTVNKVHCPNGYFGIVTYVTVHDDTFNAYVGLKVPQGNQLGTMGTKGNATGVHCHLELIQASMGPSNWYQNSYGVWTFNGNESYVDDTFYVDDTNIIYGGAGNWRKTGSSSGYNEKDLIAETGVATLTVDNVQARLNSPTGKVVRKYSTGDKVTYSWKWVGNGHRYIVWKEGNNKIFLAVSNSEKQGVEPWATFAPVESEKPSSRYSESQLIKEHGVAKFTRDDIIVRKNKPDGEDTGKRFMSGDTQEYTEKWVGNGHRYISWIENGTRYFCAVSGSETRGEDSWATFTAPEDVQEKPTDPVTPPEEEPSDTDDDFIVEQPNLTVELYQPTEGWLEHNGKSLVYDVVTKDEYKYKAPFIMNPEYPVVHNAGTPNDHNAKTLNESMRNDKTTQKSWHFSVDENTIVEGLPLNRNGWHAGDGRDGDGNRKGIAIEICRDMLDSNDEKFSQAEETSAILLADLMYQKGFKNIKKHQDFADKYCPHKTLYKGWDRYVDMVTDYLNKLIQFKEGTDTPSEPTEDDKPTDEPNTPSEEEKPSDTPNEPDNGIDTDKVNSLLDVLIKLGNIIIKFIKKILSIFK